MHRSVTMIPAVLIVATLGIPQAAQAQGNSRGARECEWDDGERRCEWADEDEGWWDRGRAGDRDDERRRDRGGWWDVILGGPDDRHDRKDERDRGDRDRDGGWGDIIFGDDGDRRDRDRARRGRGPAFCRSGAGHPVFGRRWCERKGFGLGDRGGLGGWGDIIFQAPRRRGVILEEGDLMDVLGDIIFMRLRDQRRRIGARGPLVGRWIEREVGDILRLHAGRTPIAEFRDLDGDRRVDRVLLNIRR